MFTGASLPLFLQLAPSTICTEMGSIGIYVKPDSFSPAVSGRPAEFLAAAFRDEVEAQLTKLNSMSKQQSFSIIFSLHSCHFTAYVCRHNNSAYRQRFNPGMKKTKVYL